MNYLEQKENIIKKEINKMSFEELIYLNMNTNYFVYNKLKPEIEEIKAKNEQIQLKQQKLQNIQENITNKHIQETIALKEQIDVLDKNINILLAERDKLNYKIPKNEFLNLLDIELKKFENPENCFNRLKEGIIDSEEFEKQFTILGKGKNYYYYKLIYDRIKND